MSLSNKILPLFYFVEDSLSISYSFPTDINIDMFGQEQRIVLVNCPVKQIQGLFFTDKLNESDLLTSIELSKGNFVGFPIVWFPIKFKNENLQSNNIVFLERSIFDYWEAYKVYNVCAYNFATREYEAVEVWHFDKEGKKVICYQQFFKNFPRETSLLYPLELFLIKDVKIKNETKNLWYIDISLEERYETAIEQRLPYIKPFFDNHNFYYFQYYFNLNILNYLDYDIQYLFEIEGNILKIWKNDLSDVLVTINHFDSNFWHYVKNDGSDIRVTNETFEQLYFYLEDFNYSNRKAKIWVRINAGTRKVYFFYGNKKATKSIYNNPYLVFDFFEDFSLSDTLDFSTWHFSGDFFRVDSDALILLQEEETNWVYLKSNKIFQYPIILEYKIGYVGKFNETGTKYDGLRKEDLYGSLSFSLDNDSSSYIGFGEGLVESYETVGICNGIDKIIENTACKTAEDITCIHDTSIVWTETYLKLRKHCYDGADIDCYYEKEFTSSIPIDSMFVVFGIRGGKTTLRSLLIYNVKVRRYTETELDFSAVYNYKERIPYWVEL